MKIVGSVSSEGGPFLLADAVAVRAWRGAAEGQADYEQLCDRLAQAGPTWGCPLRIGECAAVVWEAEGEGTADVLVAAPDSLLLVRGWFDGDWTAATMKAAAVTPGDGQTLGTVEISRGVLAILWAPEEGASITDADVARGAGEPSELAISGSSLLVPLPSGRYECFADQVHVDQGSALRCFMRPERR